MQSGNDGEMDVRMLEYYPLLWRQFGVPPKQWVLYFGSKPLTMNGRIEHPRLRYSYEIVDFSSLDAKPLLESDSATDNLLALLCRGGTERRAIKQILRSLARLPKKELQDRLTQLLILAGLREAEALVIEEVKKMTLEINVMENSFLRGIFLDGEKAGEERGLKRGEERGLKRGEERGLKRGRERGIKEGAAGLLRQMLEHRFGRLPAWAIERLQDATPTTLERWGARLLTARKLEDVIPRSRAANGHKNGKSVKNQKATSKKQK
ncbi:MAG: hypothetical protein ACREEM_12820 [Blastocatellia bacterium]